MHGQKAEGEDREGDGRRKDESLELEPPQRLETWEHCSSVESESRLEELPNELLPGGQRAR
jgi:hypothetical protein